MGLELSAEVTAELEGRIEGWIAGLQMAALAMRDHADIPGFIAAFAGSNRYELDYLAEEVLARQPEELQTFLLETSILDRMRAPLCNALTERADGQTALERLEHANLFVIPLDDERHWYRYHHLWTCCASACAGRTPISFRSYTAGLVGGSSGRGWLAKRSTTLWTPRIGSGLSASSNRTE
jgi:ATP/maltotriose-dependent transcriptional regulator MalT